MKVLIADDDKLLSHLLTVRLQANGCEVVTAVDAMQAFMLATRVRPDAIVLDINMPGGTGVEALKKLKMSSKTARVPVVVMSASLDPEATSVAMRELGAAAYLQKPVDAGALYEMLTQLSQARSEAPKG